MLEGVFFMQNLISVPVPMTSCRQEAYLQRLRRQFPFVYVKTLTRTAFGRSVYALQFGSGSRKLLITAIGAHTIRMVPPLIVNEEQCDKAVEIITEAVEAVAK